MVRMTTPLLTAEQVAEVMELAVSIGRVERRFGNVGTYEDVPLAYLALELRLCSLTTPAARGPLTPSEIMPGFEEHESSMRGKYGAAVWLTDFTAGVRFAERALKVGVTALAESATTGKDAA